MSLFDWKKFSHQCSKTFAQFIGLTRNQLHSSSFHLYYHEKTAETLLQLKAATHGRTRVLDIGCGKQSYLADFNKKEYGYELTGMDISDAELSVNPFVDHTIIIDGCNPNFADILTAYQGTFDLVVSHSFFEHVPKPEITHRMIHYLLKKDGIAIHSYPTLFDPLLVAGHLLPTRIAATILFAIEPFRRAGGKFKTYYRHCRGYSGRQDAFFSSLGYQTIGWRNFFGSLYLYSIFPLQMVMDLFYRTCIFFKLSLFSTYSTVILLKK
jgi:2-polyprenyl-3-methyl-5-hydroxy-6-metoxy-1,4-benzoquinol methylase